jgi:hypothetical protein
MFRKRFLAAVAAVFFVVCFSSTVSGYQNMPVAKVSVGSFGIHFQTNVTWEKAMVTVSSPDGQVYYKSFNAGTTPYIGLSDTDWNLTIDGTYTYELRLIPYIEKRVRKDMKETYPLGDPMVQSGHFTIRGGSIVPMYDDESGPAKPLDVLHYDDVIITGSLCVGWDCANGESFGYCTIKLKENNLQLCFEDTSVGSFPTNDWKIQINDTTSGGASYFTIWDTDGGRRPFTLEAGAPAHSLYVEDYGRVGLGTSIPYVELHIVDGDSPTIRLDQDGSSGWTAQRWDLCGNETNFFIRDVTNGSKLCFRIQPNTPSSTLCLRSTGNVGIGTWSPLTPLEVETTGEHSTIIAERTDGATAQVSGRSDKAMIGSRSNHNLNLCANNEAKMTIEPGGDVGIGGTNPIYKLQVYNAAGTAYGYSDGGAWNTGSSREFKENIKDLDAEEAMAVFTELNPITFNYKGEQDEEQLGFIAEEVPEMVATKNRDAISAMDIVTLLTKVVQEQQKTITKLEKKIEEIENK